MLDPEELSALIVASAQGERDAFAKVYQLTSGKLLAIALRIVRRREVAEEVLQEAFVSIWEKSGQHSQGSAFAWMTTIVRHRAIDKVRAAKDGPPSAAKEDYGPALQLVLQEAMGASIRECIELLQEQQRKSIVLSYYYGLTHTELAARLAAPLGTVKSWVRRGLLELKDCLA